MKAVRKCPGSKKKKTLASGKAALDIESRNVAKNIANT